MQIDSLKDMLDAELDGLGEELSASRDEVKKVLSEQALALSLVLEEPGFEKALVRSRNIVALAAGLEASDAARAVDSRLVGFFSGVLRVAAVALA